MIYQVQNKYMQDTVINSNDIKLAILIILFTILEIFINKKAKSNN